MISYIKKTDLGSKKLIGAEIGVDRGANAKDILDTLRIQKLFLIDPYENYIEKGFFSSVVYSSLYMLQAKNILIDHEDKILFIKKRSDAAIVDLPASLDFVYIDGDHSYNGVKKDINNYFPKVKSGGVIGGHDINSPGILLAVLQFCFKKRILRNLHIRKCDWWIQK